MYAIRSYYGSPDFGVQGVLDRFGQIAPKVLFCTDRYLYGGKAFSTLDKVGEILQQLPSVTRCVVLPYEADAPDRAGAKALPNGLPLRITSYNVCYTKLLRLARLPNSKRR